VALVVAIFLAVLPAVAEAQSITTTQEAAAQGADANPAAAGRVVVISPGDSLWKISAERLDADATLAQIDREVERIYALNRHRIGADPNLIFPGQVLLVAPAEGKQAAADRRSGEPVVSESASKKGARVVALKPAPKKAAKKSAQVRLTPSGNSGVSGTATLTDVEGSVKVELNMQGLPEAGVEYINHIHGGGTCADDRAGRTAPVTIPLKTVVAKGNGTGSATTTIKGVTLEKLFGGNQARFILLHAKTKKGKGVPPGISCADLPQGTASGGFETLPASGGFSLPALPAAKQAVPEVGLLSETDAPSPTNGSPVVSFLRDARSVVAGAASELGESLTEVRAAAVEAPRATLGWVIVVLTVVVGALMAWKLPMRRTTRWEAQRWRIPSGYHGGGRRYTSYWDNRPSHESPPGVAPVAFKSTTNNSTEANDSSAEKPPNRGIQAARRRRARRRAWRVGGRR
jgi:hypothetical protein